MTGQGRYIRLNHARDHLRQHFAIDAGIDPMDFRPLGSDPRSVSPEMREICRTAMSECRDKAHEEIAGYIGGAKITVWRETDTGGIKTAGPLWAQKAFDGADGLTADKLYFVVSEWDQILASITTEKSRAYLAIPQASRLIADEFMAVSAQFPTYAGKRFDWPIWRAVEHVRAVIEDDDEHSCFERTQTALRQAALDDRIALFGRAELPPPKAAGHPSEVWTRIRPEYWEGHKFTTLATGEHWAGHDHTMRDPFTTYGFGERYWQLLANREEIEAAWPPEWTRWSKLLAYWKSAAERDFTKARDLANSKACLAGGTAGSAHIGMLMDAALQPVIDMLEKARQSNAPQGVYPSLLTEGLNWLDEFQLQAANVVFNPSGRSRAGEAGRQHFDRLAQEGKERVQNLVDQWVAEDACKKSAPGTESGSQVDGKDIGFISPQVGWLELWQGPLKFRATYDKGEFGPGHTIERMHQYADEGASGNGRHVPLYSVRVDDADGAIVIEWLSRRGTDGRTQQVRYYDGLGRGLYEKLRDDAALRADQFRMFWLQPEQYERAVGAFATAVSVQEWLRREFYDAIHAGQCEIWARVGSKIAPFKRVPADIFRAYTIKSWGFGQPGAAWAELEGEAPLYAIHVAPCRAILDRVIETDRQSFTISAGTSQRPGPARHPIVLQAIEVVEADCTRARYTKPLKHGEFEGIKTMLRETIEKLSGGALSRDDKSLRKYAGEIVARFPDG